MQLKLSKIISIQYLITLSIRYPTGLVFSVSNRLSLGEWYSTVLKDAPQYLLHNCMAFRRKFLSFKGDQDIKEGLISASGALMNVKATIVGPHALLYEEAAKKGKVLCHDHLVYE